MTPEPVDIGYTFTVAGPFIDAPEPTDPSTNYNRDHMRRWTFATLIGDAARANDAWAVLIQTPSCDWKLFDCLRPQGMHEHPNDRYMEMTRHGTRAALLVARET